MDSPAQGKFKAKPDGKFKGSFKGGFEGSFKATFKASREGHAGGCSGSRAGAGYRHGAVAVDDGQSPSRACRSTAASRDRRRRGHYARADGRRPDEIREVAARPHAPPAADAPVAAILFHA